MRSEHFPHAKRIGGSIIFDETLLMLITVKILFEAHVLLIHMDPFGGILVNPSRLSYYYYTRDVKFSK